MLFTHPLLRDSCAKIYCSQSLTGFALCICAGNVASAWSRGEAFI